MAEFDVDTFLGEFLQTPTFEALNKLRKSDLLPIGTKYGLEVKQSMRKHEIMLEVLTHFVDDGVLDNQELITYRESVDPLANTRNPTPEIEMEKLKLAVSKANKKAPLKKGLVPGVI